MTGAADDDRLARVDASVVSAALSHLQPLHREVLRKAQYMGWTTDQIAADLNIAEAAVKSQLHDALLSVRLFLTDPTQRPRPHSG
jgi:RNA polymerase sigma-70 factor (ECF subfamily)